MAWTVLASRANLWSIKKEWCLEDTLMGKEGIAACWLPLVLWKQSSAIIMKAESPESRWVKGEIALFGCIFLWRKEYFIILLWCLYWRCFLVGACQISSHKSWFFLETCLVSQHHLLVLPGSHGWCWRAVFLCVPQRSGRAWWWSLQLGCVVNHDNISLAKLLFSIHSSCHSLFSEGNPYSRCEKPLKGAGLFALWG